MRARSGLIRSSINAAALTLGLVGLSVSWAQPAGAAAARPAGAGRFFLQLEGADIGFVRSVDGGDAVADVVEAQAGAGATPNKHPSNPKYQDLVIEIGYELDAPIYRWIADSLEGKVTRKSGVIISADHNFKALERLVFKNALLKAIEFSSFDAAAKQQASIILRLAAESTRTEAADGAALTGVTGKTKAALASSFRLDVDGVDTKLVSKVEGVSASFKIAASAVGDARDPSKESAKLALTNLNVTVSAPGAQDFRSWHDSFVIQGKNGDSAEKSGAIVLLSPDLKSELARISLYNLGILRAAPSKREPNSDKAATFGVELYVERARLLMPGVSSAAPKAVRAVPAPKL